jgi:hypothetical protein
MIRACSLGPKRRVLGNAGVVTALPVLNPVLRKIEFPIEEGAPAVRRGIIQKDANLAILDLACGATVLSLDPSRLNAFLDEPSLINDQSPAFEAEIIFNIVVETIPNTVCVPLRNPQQPLHPIRHLLAGLFRQLPAVLAFRRPQQTLQIRKRAIPRLLAQKAAAKPPVQLSQFLHPRRDVHRATNSRQSL